MAVDRTKRRNAARPTFTDALDRRALHLDLRWLEILRHSQRPRLARLARRWGQEPDPVEGAWLRAFGFLRWRRARAPYPNGLAHGLPDSLPPATGDKRVGGRVPQSHPQPFSLYFNQRGSWKHVPEEQGISVAGHILQQRLWRGNALVPF